VKFAVWNVVMCAAETQTMTQQISRDWKPWKCRYGQGWKKSVWLISNDSLGKTTWKVEVCLMQYGYKTGG